MFRPWSQSPVFINPFSKIVSEQKRLTLKTDSAVSCGGKGKLTHFMYIPWPLLEAGLSWIRFLSYLHVIGSAFIFIISVEGVGKPVQIIGARPSGRGPDCVAYVFVSVGSVIIRRLYLSDEARVTLQLTVSLCDLVSRVLAGPPSPGGTKKFFTEARTRSRRPCLWSSNLRKKLPSTKH